MPRIISKITDTEKALLAAAGPLTDSLLPATWWAEYLSLFIGKAYTPSEATQVLTLYKQCYERNCADCATVS